MPRRRGSRARSPRPPPSRAAAAAAPGRPESRPRRRRRRRTRSRRDSSHGRRPACAARASRRQASLSTSASVITQTSVVAWPMGGLAPIVAGQDRGRRAVARQHLAVGADHVAERVHDRHRGDARRRPAGRGRPRRGRPGRACRRARRRSRRCRRRTRRAAATSRSSRPSRRPARAVPPPGPAPRPRRRRGRRSPRPARSAPGRRASGGRCPAPPAPAMTPSAAASPNALPPVSRIASTRSTVASGASSAVSRVPGARPRTSHEAVEPGGGRITVQPVRRASSVKWPMRRPPITRASGAGSAGRRACRDRRRGA